MDLALEFGVPADALARQMLEPEFKQWGRYAEKKLLPARRMEFYLAQIAMLIARSNGADVALSDFLYQQPADDGDEATDLESAKAAFNFNPRFKK